MGYLRTVPKQVPRQLGPYRLVRPLGSGAFAPVWLAEEVYEERVLRLVAVKLFSTQAPCAYPAEQIIDEARALCRVEHPCVVRFYALHRSDEQELVGIIMEYAAGTNLAALLEESGPLALADVIEAGIAVAWALAAVHVAGLVHRDVKPGNIVKGPSGYKLVDFGIVAPNLPYGTPGFVAPECLQGSAPSSANDVYALGVTLQQLTSSRSPSPNATQAHELAQLVSLMLQPNPRDRPSHAEWVARRLEWIRSLDTAQALRNTDCFALKADRANPAMQPPPWRPHPVLTGRTDVLETVRWMAAEVRHGLMRVLLLSGPLGVGRSRLLREAIHTVGLGESRTLVLRCSSERRGPLRPLIRALESIPNHDDAALGLLRDAVDYAVSPSCIDQAAGSLALESVEDALLWASRQTPLLVVVDDIQWGDEQTLALLRLLVERAQARAENHLLLIMAVRDEPRASIPLTSLLQTTRAAACERVKRFELGPLSNAEVIDLAHAIAPVDQVIERAIVRGAGGIPLFVMHALTGWRDRGQIVFDDNRWHPTNGQTDLGPVPSVAEIIQMRLAISFGAGTAIANTALRVLAAIALHDGGMRIEFLFGLFDHATALDELLEILAEVRLLSVHGDPVEYGFGQEMVRQSVLNMVRHKPWFFRLQRDLLDRMASSPHGSSESAFLASGYERLGARDEARLWLGRAMQTNAAAGLFMEAANFGDRLISVHNEPTKALETELDVIRLLIRGRFFEQAKERLNATGSVIGALHVDVRRGLELRHRIAKLEVARGLREPTDPDRDILAIAAAIEDKELLCEAYLAVAGIARGAEALQWATDAIAIARDLGATAEFGARVRRLEINYDAEQRDAALAREDLERALALATLSKSAWQRIHIEGDLVILDADLGQVDAAIERLARLSTEAKAKGMHGQVRLLHQNMAALFLRTNRYDEAVLTARRTAELATMAGDAVLHATALSLEGDALRRQGDLERALQCLDEAIRLQRPRNDPSLALALLRRAEVFHESKEVEGALRDAIEARTIATRNGDRDLVIGARLSEALARVAKEEVLRDNLALVVSEAQHHAPHLRRLTRDILQRACALLNDGSPSHSTIRAVGVAGAAAGHCVASAQ